MLKVGNKVKIIKRVDKEKGWDNDWVSSMDGAIGKEFVIEEVRLHQGMVLGGEDPSVVGYGFPPSSLELVNEDTKPLPSKTIFRKNYASEELGDLFEDIMECFDEKTNAEAKGIPMLDNSFHRGHFEVSVTWHDEDE